MFCKECGEACRRFGQTKHGQQRFQCKPCKKTFSEPRPAIEDRRRIDRERAVLVLRMLLEGNSIRSVERLTETHRDTIMALMFAVGDRCVEFLDETIKGVPVEDVQCDEIWSFIGCKEKTREARSKDDEFGDAYCFTAIERTSKLLVAWHLGKRCANDAWKFAERLKEATSGRFQLTTDGFKPYQTAIPGTFKDVDFGVLIKVYKTAPELAGRYSPGEVIETRSVVQVGNPIESRICTSHVERSNLTIRMQVRRFTRLTNAFSKKWDNHQAMLGLFFAYYNFCRVHTTLKTTPAVAAGLATKTWSVADLVARILDR